MACGSYCSGFDPEVADLDGLGAAEFKMAVTWELLVKTMPVSQPSPGEP